jgi:hypothetical protein
MSLQVFMSIDIIAWCLMGAFARDVSGEELLRIGSIGHVSPSRPAVSQNGLPIAGRPSLSNSSLTLPSRIKKLM